MEFNKYWEKFGELHASMCGGNIKTFAEELYKAGQANAQLSSREDNRLNYASQQLIGFQYGKWNRTDPTGLVEEMGLTKDEWLQLKQDYPIDETLDADDIKEINEHFGIISENISLDKSG